MVEVGVGVVEKVTVASGVFESSGEGVVVLSITRAGSIGLCELRGCEVVRKKSSELLFVSDPFPWPFPGFRSRD